MGVPQDRLPNDVQTIPVPDLRPAPDRLRMFSMLEVIWQMSIRVDKERQFKVVNRELYIARYSRADSYEVELISDCQNNGWGIDPILDNN